MIVLFLYSLILGCLSCLCSALQIPFLASQSHRSAVFDDRMTASSSAPPGQLKSNTFTLRQALHASTSNRDIPVLQRHYSTADLVTMESASGHSQTQSLSAQMTTAWRPSSNEAYQAARRSAYAIKKAARTGHLPTWSDVQDQLLAHTLGWEEHDILMPNITDVGTINALAKMASNAYTKENSGSWWDLDGKWNVVSSLHHIRESISGGLRVHPSIPVRLFRLA